MEVNEEGNRVNHSPSKRRRAVSTAELYSALEALLPFARTEVICLGDDLCDLQGDPDHAEIAAREQRGRDAIQLAERLIARKTHYVRRKEQALKAERGHADA